MNKIYRYKYSISYNRRSKEKIHQIDFKAASMQDKR